MGNIFKDSGKIISDLFYPPRCIFCQTPLPFKTRPLLCAQCLQSLLFSGDTCSRCGGDFSLNKDGLPVCPTCKSARYPFEGVLSSYRYQGAVRNALISFKFSFYHNISPALAHGISNLIRQKFNPNAIDCLLFVPSSRKRIRERGFDAMYEIAKETSLATNIPFQENVLIRSKHVVQQSLLSRSERLRNAHGTFQVTDSSLVRERNILLLDDIYTTGATTRECAKVLKRAGASYVFVVTVAISQDSFL